MMHMTFYWSNKVTILVDSWRTDSWISYALTLLACLLAASFYQYLENHRIRLKLLSGKQPHIQVPFLRPNLAAAELNLVGALLYGLNSAIGYLLMLAVMSFNGGVFVVTVVGLTVGYFIFRSQGEDHAPTVLDNSCACA